MASNACVSEMAYVVLVVRFLQKYPCRFTAASYTYCCICFCHILIQALADGREYKVAIRMHGSPNMGCGAGWLC